MSRKSSRRYWTKSLELWRAEIEWSCGISACFQLGFAKHGLVAILVLELPSRSHRRLCPPSRLQKKCKSDLIRKLRRWIEQRERSRNFSRSGKAHWCCWAKYPKVRRAKMIALLVSFNGRGEICRPMANAFQREIEEYAPH